MNLAGPLEVKVQLPHFSGLGKKKYRLRSHKSLVGQGLEVLTPRLSGLSAIFSPPSFRHISWLAPKHLPSLFRGTSLLFLLFRHCWNFHTYIPYIPHPCCSFLLLHLNSFPAAHLGCSCLASLHLQSLKAWFFIFAFWKAIPCLCSWNPLPSVYGIYVCSALWS